MTLGPSSSAFVSFLSYHWLFNVATSFVNGPLQITLSNILSEMMCITIVGSSSESECDATSDSVDVECLSWDNSEDLYRLYSYDEDYNDDENGNHGPKTGQRKEKFKII